MIASGQIDMTLRMQTCPITAISKKEIKTVTIDADGEETKVTFDDWFADGAALCYYTWNYEALHKDVPIQAAALAANVLFDESSREFTVSSETGGLNYTITIRGNLTDGITTDTQ